MGNRKLDQADQALVDQKEKTEAAERREAEVRREAEEELGVLRGMVDSSNFEIERLVEEVSQKEAEAAWAAHQLEGLKEEIQPVLDANPKVKEFVLGLMGQVALKDDVIFSLKKIVAEADERDELRLAQIQEHMTIAASWKHQCENEKALRVASESVLVDYQRALRKANTKTKVFSVAAGIAGALLGSAIGG
jgi:hypothetical protein